MRMDFEPDLDASDLCLRCEAVLPEEEPDTSWGADYCSELCSVAPPDETYADLYVGDEQGGVYIKPERVAGRYYVTTVVDCDTAGFVDTLHEKDGPYETLDLAVEAGKCVAGDWCIDNGINTDGKHIEENHDKA